MILRNATMPLGLAWLGRSIALFFQRVKSYFINFTRKLLPKTGRIAPCLRLFAFLEKGSDLIFKFYLHLSSERICS